MDISLSGSSNQNTNCYWRTWHSIHKMFSLMMTGKADHHYVETRLVTFPWHSCLNIWQVNLLRLSWKPLDHQHALTLLMMSIMIFIWNSRELPRSTRMSSKTILMILRNQILWMMIPTFLFNVVKIKAVLILSSRVLFKAWVVRTSKLF